MTNLDITCQYDLMGVINHYGSLSFGHYVSMNKNPYDGQWYKYDDQLRIPIPESQIAKESAYILFYIRKDVISKSLSEIFPSINECFPGKPISTKYGDGYILGEKYEQNFVGNAKAMAPSKTAYSALINNFCCITII